LFDRCGVGCEGFSCGYEDEVAHLDGFAAALKKEPESWGCIVAYAQTGDDRDGMEWDAPGTARKIALSQRNYLIKKRGLAPKKLTAADGGYSWRGVELWVIRPGERFDKGPFVYSGRLRATRNGTLQASQGTEGICCRACVRGGTDLYMLRPEKSKRTLKCSRESATQQSLAADGAIACFSSSFLLRGLNADRAPRSPRDACVHLDVWPSR
jgi:hypothetical protein